MPISTLSDLFFHVRDISAGRTELLSVRLPKGRETLSAADFLSNVHSLALALEALGVKHGDRVALYSENRPEWHVVDFACHLVGAPTVPLYPTLAAQQVGYILRNSGSRLVFYSDAGKRDLLIELQKALTVPLQVVAFEADATVPGGVSITRLMGQEAARRGEVPVERFRGRVEPDDLASIVYTSGTTGDPKGVMLSHRNLVSNFLACAEIFDVGPRDLALSFLPLAHVFQRTVDHLCFYRGVAIHYVPAIERVQSALAAVRPTLLVSVPRFYERAYLGVMSRRGKESALRRLLFRWAIDLGKRYATARHTSFIGPFLALRRQLADRLVFRRIRARFGGRLRIAISGGAPLTREVSEFFEAVGMPVFQGYGLTESSPVLTSTAPDRQRQGSVGKALSGVELRLATDGEVLARGPGITRGYWKNPQATEEAIDGEGWLHTGDVGRFDQSGYLFITDRKKDMLVTSGGKNIAPQPIENLLTSHGLIAQAVVVGDGYPFVAVLLVPDFQQLAAEVEARSPQELIEHPETREKIDAIVREVNGKLTAHERLRRWKLL
ncbi:MAG: long-chain fatty acid--CoA ligase, partial [bacterium]|nr:long-chain fatty acid--CoA ligase [bacterium]